MIRGWRYEGAHDWECGARLTDVVPSNELSTLHEVMRKGDLGAALAHLNARVPFRFTGVYRVRGGELLESVAIYDRWISGFAAGGSAPLSERYCSYVVGGSQPLEVADGLADPRFPHHPNNPAVSYCGAPIQDHDGRVLGTLCHFDLKPCQAPSTEAPFLLAAAGLFTAFVS